MGLRIECPNCGMRDLAEWSFGEILDPPADLSAEERAVDRAYLHTNTAGVVTEAWFHLAGCRRWVEVRRDTRTDEFR